MFSKDFDFAILPSIAVRAYLWMILTPKHYQAQMLKLALAWHTLLLPKSDQLCLG